MQGEVQEQATTSAAARNVETINAALNPKCLWRAEVGPAQEVLPTP